MNLQKALQTMFLSRRKSSEYILTNGVKVNGKLIKEPWYELNDTDIIEFDNTFIKVSDIIKTQNNKVYYLLNKPKGYLCTFKDEYGRNTIQELIKNKIKEKVFYVGRLDYDSSGILLLTNDGKFANFLLRPENNISKVYNVLINGVLSQKEILKLKNGVLLETGYKTLPAKIKILQKHDNSSLIQITINEGKKRQIKLMIKSLGYKVIELTRIKFGPWSIREVPHPGDIKKINEVDFAKIGYKK
ncbi:pseudouridine synthase [Defluviitoga tunisiensis]|uniref:Pseudouridine synthase n=1 Tax=Defluviitoga tunisiensis TaxID=1006576 RepID=A0A0C7P108_DEFTU|nr:pseudouridine synthase [Defluviitoga tunisiensis]CEP77694.1 16S rRNA pseudouridine(516) synthase [Defluviitoga tunisiensis]